MQQQTPPQGRLFPDPPQEQQKPAAPRFASTATQPYEPQPRMQHTGAYPTYSSARYTTNSLQTLHTQPVQTMPPMAAMPTAQAYQAAMQQKQQHVEGNPVIVQTVQGTPVLVTVEQLQSALKGHEAPVDEKKQRKSRKEKKERKPRRFSLVWFVFGLIGMGTTAIAVLRVVITLLLKLKGAL